MTDVASWDTAAAQWIAWVRTKNHDPFWAYQSAFEAFVGAGPGQGVELGAGEGRISRVLGALGWEMTVVEPIVPLLSAAEAADSGARYVKAPGHDVPLGRGAFDLVVLYNVLMDVDDLMGTAGEAARLVSPGGRVIVGIVHPIQDVRTGDERATYFKPQHVDVTLEDNGLSMRFCGWRRPLSAYVNALSAAGLAMTRMAEPAPDPAHPAAGRFPAAQTTPMFLWMEFAAPG
ncbi:MAG: class I SAM-dependent methyltransferase [Pseudomonadota bacterium]